MIVYDTEHLERLSAEIAAHKRALAALQVEYETAEQSYQHGLAQQRGLVIDGLYQYIGDQPELRGRIVTLEHLLTSTRDAYVICDEEQAQVAVDDLAALDPFIRDTLLGVIHAKD